MSIFVFGGGGGGGVELLRSSLMEVRCSRLPIS